MQKLDPLYIRWLSLADEDLRYVKKALRDEDCMNVAIFNTQQCVERSKLFCFLTSKSLKENMILYGFCSSVCSLINHLMRLSNML